MPASAGMTTVGLVQGYPDENTGLVVDASDSDLFRGHFDVATSRG